MKKIKNYLLAFLIPFIICIAFLYCKNILQNIENIYVSDLRLQHLPFLNYLKSVLLGQSSIHYSFSAGLGSPMISTMIFYCISPVNLLLLVIKDIKYAILFVYITKISLSGLTMYILLKNKTEKDNFMTILFSTCYALCAFVINYFFCMFWFDSIYLAPLVTLGIDKMFKEERINLLYIFSLALAIICNIQMGFGLCVYSLIYYIYSYNSRYDLKKDLKKLKQLSLIFIISSLCAGAISSGVLIGFMAEYKNISIARDIKVETSAGTSNLAYILKNLFTVGNVKKDFYNNYEPYTYCGLIVSFLSVLFLFNDEIEKKKRFHAIGVILVFIISFSINSINLFWHLSSPVLLNYRYSIYLGLFLTQLAYECYTTKKKLTKKDIIVLSISLLVGLSMIIAHINNVKFLETFIFLILIYTLIILTKNKSKKFEILLSISIIAEIFVNSYSTLYTATQLPFGKDTSYESLKKIAAKNNFENDYRVLYDYSYTDFTNDSFLLNNNSSPRYFSSVINGNLLNFFYRNDSAVGNNNYRTSAYDSPLLLSLLGNKYFYYKKELDAGIYKKVNTYKAKSYDYINKKYKTQDVYLYENPYALSIGYMIERDTKYRKGTAHVDYQNEIIKSFTGIDKNIMILLNYNVATDTDDCKNSNFIGCQHINLNNPTLNKAIYIYGLYDEYTVYNRVNVYQDSGTPLLITTPNNNIELALRYGRGMERYLISTYDEEALIESLNKLKENMMTNVKIKKNIMTGTIIAKKSGTLFLSIPYDKNFKIYVDNKKVKYYPLLDNTFIGLDLEEGAHNIKLKYTDDNLKWYILSSVVSIIITVTLYYFINKKINQKKKEEIEKQKELEEKKKKKNNKKKNKKVK